MFARSVAVVVAVLVAVAMIPPASGQGSDVPRTGFETSDGAEWTTHEQEIEFLAEVDRLSRRVRIDVIGETVQKRPLHLVRVGNPSPPSPGAARRRPTVLFVCSQHGNEPAGREACLQLLRDLAFADDPATEELLRRNSILFVPSANPDGRAANTRENSQGIDINRDHLNLETNEAKAVARAVRDWRPEVVLDLHEYGPSIPAFYDDEVLYLWPRNLNVDGNVHDLAKTLATDYIAADAVENGYTADEYGMYALADQDVHQSAGDGDEGILRNTMGLRHSLGVLVETAVTQDPRNGPDEVTSEAAVQRRRVASHMVVSLATLRFLGERGDEAARTTTAAFKLAISEGKSGSEPVYFGGADNQEPEEAQVQDPPPCGYNLTAEQANQMKETFSLLGIKAKASGGSAYVPMGQISEPLIPLLLDERGARHSVAAEAQECA